MYPHYRLILGCGGELYLTDDSITDVITSPGYPHSYPSNVECEWRLRVPAGRIVDFKLEAFNISSSFLCREDNLELRNSVVKGATVSSALIGRFCGSNIPHNMDFKSSSNVMYIKFRSYRSSGARFSGFKATWKIGKFEFISVKFC